LLVANAILSFYQF